MAYIETIPPATGRRESFWVMLSIALILLLGAIGLRFNSVPAPQHNTGANLELTPIQRQLIMELSIALPEIHLEQTVNGSLPSVAELSELGISPFYSEQPQLWTWQQLGPCYLATPTQPAYNAFLLHPQQQSIYIALEPPHDTHSCPPDHGWQPVAQLATENAP